MEREFRISLKILDHSLPDKPLKLLRISPVRDGVRVDCDCHVNAVQKR